MLTAKGKLVEIETNDNGFRTAVLLDGRYVDSYSVSSKVNGELHDGLVGTEVELLLGRTVKWMDNPERPGKRMPVENTYVRGVVSAEHVESELPVAA